jgi:hypothetical protein
MFRLNCARCKRKMLANTKATDNMAGKKSTLCLSPSLSEVPPLVTDDALNHLPDAMDYLPPGQLAALLCINRGDSCDELKGILEGLGYVVDMSGAADHALQRLRFNQYRVILLDDDFARKSPNPVASYLAGLNMNTRREMFVGLVGQHFKTADHLQAFIESVNLTLHPDDLPQLAPFLTEGLRDHERFYKVFTECLIKAGKKI